MIPSSTPATITAPKLLGVASFLPVRDASGTVTDFSLLRSEGLQISPGGKPGLLSPGRPLSVLASAWAFPDLVEPGRLALAAGKSRRLELAGEPARSLRPVELALVPLAGNLILIVSEGAPILPEGEAETLSALFQTVPSGMVYSLPLRDEADRVRDFQVVACNEIIGQLTGFSRYQMLTQSMLTCDPAGAASGVFERWVKVLESGEAREFDHFFAEGGCWLRQKLTPYRGGILASFTDVTASYTQHSLQKQTDLLQAVVDTVQVCISLLSPVRDSAGEIRDFRPVLNNAYVMDTFKQPTAGLDRGKGLGELVPGWTESENFAIYREVMQTGVPRSWGTFHDAYGVKGWVEIRACPVQDYILVNVVDKTAAREAELKQRQQADTFQAVLRSMLHGLTVFRIIRDEAGGLIDLRYEFVSDQLLRDTGMSRSELVGNTQLSCFPGVLHSRFWPAYEAVIRTGQPQQFDDYYDQDGFRNHVICQVVQIDADRLVCTYQIVNALKQAQEEAQQQAQLLESVILHSPSGLILAEPLMDEQGQIVDFRYQLTNEYNAQLFGFRAGEMIGRSFSSLLPDWQQLTLFQAMTEVFRSGQSKRYRDKLEGYGVSIWIDHCLVRHQDCVLVTFVDISAIVEAEEAQRQQAEVLEQMNAELKRSNEALQQFAYVASHDLQEPLRKIKVFGNMLAEGHTRQLSEEGLDLVMRMNGAASRMADLVRDLLTYSRLTTQMQPFQPVSLPKVLEMVLNDQSLLIQEHGAQVEVGELPTLLGNGGQLYQLFQNLIGNALKYSAVNKVPRVTLASRRVPYDHVPSDLLPLQARTGGLPASYWEITVEDNGIGFDEKYRERIFGMFQRLHGMSQYPGNGMGLAICRRIAENHHGTITGRSQPGQGATFCVYLPENAAGA